MSESSIFPGADDESATMAPLDEVDADGNDGAARRKLMIVGGAVGVVIVLAAGYFLLHKGSSATPAAAPTTPVVSSSSPSVATKTAHKVTTRHLPKVAKQADVRDPFTALITAPVAAGTQPQSTTTVSSNPTPSSSASEPTSTTTTTSTPPVVIVSSPATAPPTSSTTATPQWIRLMKVKGQVATFDVGYSNNKFKQYIVTAPKPSATTGTVFDSIFTLIGVESGQANNELATIQIGDGSPFDLPTGVSHNV